MGKALVKLSSALRLVGTTLTLLSLVFLGYFIWKHFTGLLDPLRGLRLLDATALFAGSILFAMLLASKGIAWYLLINRTVGGNQTPVTVLHVHGTTQIMKYLPGNVFHYAGRQLRGSTHGWPQMATATSSLAESGLNVTGGVLVSLAAVLLLPAHPLLEELSRHAHLAWIVGLIGLPLLFLFLKQGSSRRAGPLARLLERNAITHAVLPALAIYVGVFAVSGLLLFLCATLLEPGIETGVVAYFLAIYPVAWLIGYLTPGAPGGLGVRESLLTIGLSLVTEESTAILVALLFRVLSTLGEFLYFLFASVVLSRYVNTPGSQPH